MNTCPNITSPAWKALVEEVGTREAYRDFFETGGVIRTANEVKQKLEMREIQKANRSFLLSNKADYDSLERINEISGTYYFDGDLASAEKVENDSAMALANDLSKRLGIEYEIVDEQQARELTKGTSNPYFNASGFFFNGKVYLVQGKITPNLVMHEFSHPFVRAISKENPELFNQLYEELLSTPEGMAIYNAIIKNPTYQNLTPGSDLFKEEVIVNALEAAKERNMQPGDTGFKKFLKEIFYAIKQMLRRAYGRKIPVSKINPNTTLSELSDILTSNTEFTIDVDSVSSDTIASYKAAEINTFSLGEDVGDNKALVSKTVETLYSQLLSDIKNFRRAKDASETDEEIRLYESLANVLSQDGVNFEDIAENLKPFGAMTSEEIDNLEADVEESKKRVTAFVDTLLRVDTAMTSVRNQAITTAQEESSRESIGKLTAYNDFAESWKNVISGFMKQLENLRKDDSSSPLNNLANDINSKLNSIINTVAQVKEDVAVDVIMDTMSQVHDVEKKRYEDSLKTLENRTDISEEKKNKIREKLHKKYYNMTAAELKRFRELGAKNKKSKQNPDRRSYELDSEEKLEWADLRNKSRYSKEITPDRIRLTLQGQMGEASFINSFAEGYMYNSDPVIGGLASYIKNTINDALAIIQVQQNNFANDIQSLLKEAGYDPATAADFGKTLGFKDKIWVKKQDSKNEYEEVEVWSFLSEFKNYRAEYDKLRMDADAKKKEYEKDKGNPEKKQAYDDSKKAFADLKSDYFHQELVSEFYEPRKRMMENPLGVDALEERDNAYAVINGIESNNKNKLHEHEVLEQLKEARRAKDLLYSLTDKYGVRKTGDALEKAILLRNYRADNKGIL